MKRIQSDRGSQTANTQSYVGRRVSSGLPLTSVMVLVTLALASHSFAVEANPGSSFTVLVFNFRQIPIDVLAKAENAADGIFEHAGVHITWRDCPTGSQSCHKGPGTVFFLAIMAGPAQNRFLDTVSGQAVVADHLATVYYDYLPRTPGGRVSTSDTSTLLGCVIAHELGHLLLGAHGHSLGGIMKASWDFGQTRRALMSGLFFLPEQGKLMKNVLREGTQPRESVTPALVIRP